jgi:hypothetical protein
MAKTKLHCGPNAGPFEMTVQGDAEGMGGGAQDKRFVEKMAILDAEAKAAADQHTLLDSCPNSCPRVANIKGEKPIKGKLVPNQTKRIFVNVTIPAVNITINIPGWVGGPFVITIPAQVFRVPGWKASAVATWHIDSFECIEGR